MKKIEILQKIRKINFKFEKKKTLLESQNLYFAPTAEYYGLLKILKLSKEQISFSLYFKIVKNILGGIIFSNPEIIKKKKIINYSNIIITWANKNNFEPDGSVNDKYFNVNSNNTNKTLWIVIYMDKYLPKNIEESIKDNIIIYKNNLKKYDFLSFIKFLYNKIININNVELLIHNLSNYTYFSEKFFGKIKKYLIKDLKCLYLPYEAQPF